MMYEDLIKRLRELQAITEHCNEHSCFECENRELCDKHDNKTLSGTYKEAADAIEELSARSECPCWYGGIRFCSMLGKPIPKPPKEES